MEPIQDLDLERAILGYLQIQPKDYLLCKDRVQPADFYRVAHQRLWCAYADTYPTIDPFAAVDVLKRKGWGDELTTVEVSNFTNGVPRSFNLPSAITRLSDMADRRRLALALKQGQEAVRTAPTAIEAVQTVSGALQASVSNHGDSGASLGDVLQGVLESLDDVPDVTTTGFRTLDEWGCGFRPGEFTILAGRPSQGKTALAQVMAHAVASAGTRVWLASLEMTSAALSLRWLASQARVPLGRLRAAAMEPPDYPRITKAVETLSDLPITVDDHAGITLGDLRRMVMGQKGVLIVDYLQLMRPPQDATRYGSRVQEVGALSRGLKAIAHDCGVSVLALSQLSRAVESRTDKSPQLSDLRESGELEQDADQVWMIWRPQSYDPEEMADRAVLKVAKHRNGPTGKVELVFDASETRFRERTMSDPWPEERPAATKAANW